jgi:hypothetical protein
MTSQDLALIMVYESVKDRLTIGLAEYLEALKDWDVVPLTESGRVIGGVLLKGNEIHVGCGIKPKGSTKGFIKKTLGDIVNKYGWAVTQVKEENHAGLRFCERLGFVKFGIQNGTILLRCDRSNYA